MPTLTQEFDTVRAYRTPLPMFTKARLKRAIEIGLPILGAAVGVMAALIADGAFNLFA
ncbi:MAG: hypothetical protein QNI84_00535 [Henriciella sp.]|nr:hypothetical protein [Henriciella sp.]